MNRQLLRISVTLLLFGLACLGHSRAQLIITGGAGAVIGFGASVTINATGIELYQANGASANYTGITVAAGTNSALVCSLSRAGAVATADAGVALSWDNAGTPQPMTLLTSIMDVATSLRLSQLWGLRAPHIGNLQLHLAWTNAAADNFIACVAFDGVNQTSNAAAFPNVATGQGQASIAVTSAAGNQVVGAYGSGLTLSGVLGTTVFTDNASGSVINGGMDYVSGGASVSVGGAAASNTIVGADVAHP
jgi:hypothetical protein